MKRVGIKWATGSGGFGLQVLCSIGTIHVAVIRIDFLGSNCALILSRVLIYLNYLDGPFCWCLLPSHAPKVTYPREERDQIIGVIYVACVIPLSHVTRSHHFVMWRTSGWMRLRASWRADNGVSSATTPLIAPAILLKMPAPNSADLFSSVSALTPSSRCPAMARHSGTTWRRCYSAGAANSYTQASSERCLQWVHVSSP